MSDKAVAPARTSVPPASAEAIAASTADSSIEALFNKIVKRLAEPKSIKGIDLDVGYFRSPDKASGPAPHALLPASYQWKTAGADTPSIPLQLCEFLAYKTALAYECEHRICDYLSTRCEGITHPAFFDARKTPGRGKLADAQGYGFVFEGRAFVVFRGTEGDKDWAINKTDNLTGLIADADRQALEDKYGAALVAMIDDEKGHGRHAGFALAWASIKSQVESWLADVLIVGEASSIIYSGHSLGGAIAQLAAFDHANINPNAIAGVVTFGAPMVGNRHFKTAYQNLLSDRTVLLQSDGDLVPRIMDRWYYKLLDPLRKRFKDNLRPDQDTKKFAAVVKPWDFPDEPPLGMRDIDEAIGNIRRAAERALEDARKEAEAKLDKRDPKGTGENGSKRGPASDPKKSTDQGGGKEAKSGGDGDDGRMPTWVLLVGGTVVILMVAGIAWYFVRRKLFAHDIQQRYALYLSTLSYQQLRARNAGDIARANRELDEHLRYIRGDLAASSKVACSRLICNGNTGKKPVYGAVLDLPVKIEIKKDEAFVKHFSAYLEDAETFL